VLLAAAAVAVTAHHTKPTRTPPKCTRPPESPLRSPPDSNPIIHQNQNRNQNQGAMFLETCAFTGENVDAVFEMCAKAVLGKVEAGVVAEASVLPADNPLHPSLLLDRKPSLPKQQCWC
jgi:hypothetical protein